MVGVVLALAGTLSDHGTQGPRAVRAQAAAETDPGSHGAGQRTGGTGSPASAPPRQHVGDEHRRAGGATAAGTAPGPDPGLRAPADAGRATGSRPRSAKWLRIAGPNSGVLVFDLSDETELYGAHPGYGRPPASVEKLWTTTAVLDRLGADFRLDTTVLGTGHLSARGLARQPVPARRRRPDVRRLRLQSRLERRLRPHPERADRAAAPARDPPRHRPRVRRRVAVRPPPRRADHRLQGRHPRPRRPAQRADLRPRHGDAARRPGDVRRPPVRVRRCARLGMQAVAGRHDGTAPLDAQILATVASPPMSVMLRLMNVPSDDLFAELFAKQLGVRFGDGGTITSGARVIAQTIASRYGLDPTILDGSGLGRQDRTSPEQIVQLLTALWHTPARRSAGGDAADRRRQRHRAIDRAQDARRPATASPRPARWTTSRTSPATARRVAVSSSRSRSSSTDRRTRPASGWRAR